MQIVSLTGQLLFVGLYVAVGIGLVFIHALCFGILFLITVLPLLASCCTTRGSHVDPFALATYSCGPLSAGHLQLYALAMPVISF